MKKEIIDEIEKLICSCHARSLLKKLNNFVQKEDYAICYTEEIKDLLDKDGEFHLLNSVAVRFKLQLRLVTKRKGNNKFYDSTQSRPLIHK